MKKADEGDRIVLRKYPDQGLRRVEGEFRNLLVETVRENFGK